MSARNEDFLFAQEAEKLGYISEQQVEEAFLLQRRMSEDLKIDERLAVILVKRGWLAEEQARRVYAIIEPKGAKQQIEGYRLVAKIGRGAMGTVYKAIHERLNRPVAIKILRRDLATDKTQIERLKSEAQLLASLDHPNIVRAVDAGESNGFPYFVMEYVEGENLRDAIIRRGPFDEDDALRITRDLALALERARRMGVVHRDVKPGNVILTRRGNVPKLMDLGLAKGPIDLGLTQQGATVGTPQFISPEQAQDPRAADTRSDIYSLGATLYAMLTSRPPFEGSTLAEIITKVLYEQPTPLRVLNDDISPEVSYLVQRMMLKDPSLRYRTPDEVADDIDRITGGQSIVPQGFTGNWEAFLLRRRMKRWVRRGLIAGTALIVLAVATVWFVRDQDRKGSLAKVEKYEAQVRDIPLAPFDVPLRSRGDTLVARLDSLRTAAARRATEAQRALSRASELRENIADHEEIAGEQGPQHDEVEAHIRRLNEYLADYQDLRDLTARLIRRFPADASLHAFGAAHSDVEAAKRRGDRLPSPVVPVLETIGNEIAAASAAALTTAVVNASTFQPSTVGQFEDRWTKCLEDVRSGRFVASSVVDAAQARIGALVRAIQLTGTELDKIQADFSTSAITPPIERGEIKTIVRAYRDQRNDMERDVRTRLSPFATDKFIAVGPERLLGEGRPVSRMLAHVRTNIDAAVQDATSALFAQAQRELDRTPFNPTEVGRLIGALTAWSNALANNYEDLVAETETLLATVGQRYKAYLTDFELYFTETRDKSFVLLRKGRPSEMLRYLDERVRDRNAQWAQDPRLEQMRWAGIALLDLQTRALSAIAKRTRMDNVRLRDRVDARWKVLNVDATRRVINVEVRVKGSSRPEAREVDIADVHPAQLLSLVPPASPRLRAVAALSAMQSIEEADNPGVDIRPVLKGWTKTQESFRALEEDDALAPWMAFVTRQQGEAVRAQEDREAGARFTEQKSEKLEQAGKWLDARDAITRLRERGGRIRYTDRFDELEDQIEKRRLRVARALDRNKKLALFPGARLESLQDGMLEIHFDMDTPESQKKNILHGLGVFELQPADQQRTTPTRSLQPRRLHLLKGATSFIRDRPLAFPQFFDPALRIEFEATIETLAGSYLLAIDIDGVKVAVCSADPRLYNRGFVRDAPLLDKEPKLPAHNFYGMGRGVAFHKPATDDFGSSFFDGKIWSWPRAGRGSNFKAWRDARKLDEPKNSLFCFERGEAYRIRVVREHDRMRLYVRLFSEKDFKLVAEMQRKEWAEVGTRSRKRKSMRHGTGRIQLLTWTPLIVDDIVLRGTLSDNWEEDRRKELEAEAEAEAEAKAGEREGTEKK